MAIAGALSVRSGIYFDVTAERDVKFETHARFRILGAILDSLRALIWSPRELRRKARGIDAVMQKLLIELGRLPDEQEIAPTVWELPSRPARSRTRQLDLGFRRRLVRQIPPTRDRH